MGKYLGFECVESNFSRVLGEKCVFLPWLYMQWSSFNGWECRCLEGEKCCSSSPLVSLECCYSVLELITNEHLESVMTLHPTSPFECFSFFCVRRPGTFHRLGVAPTAVTHWSKSWTRHNDVIACWAWIIFVDVLNEIQTKESVVLKQTTICCYCEEILSEWNETQLPPRVTFVAKTQFVKESFKSTIGGSQFLLYLSDTQGIFVLLSFKNL